MIDLSTVPPEILDVVISVISRLAFDLAVWSKGGLPMLLVCEEAHRYAPADDEQVRAHPPGAVAHRQGRPQIRPRRWRW